MKSPTLSKLKKELWKVIAEYVKRRDNPKHFGLCLACKNRPIQVAAHIVPKSESAWTAFDATNIYGCCAPCNNDERWHRASWVKHHEKLFGIEFVRDLFDRAHPKDTNGRPLIKDWTKHEVIELTTHYKELLEELK